MFYDNEDFYPTPAELADKMVAMADLKRVHFVLEPSAGKGDLVTAIENKMRYAGYSEYTDKHGSQVEIDCIEQDSNLQNLLKGAGKRLVYDDFLNFETFKRYDLILMNPPFSAGERHLLKALKMMENGGQVVCLLNAETLKNPYSNIRKELVEKLAQLDAEIEYLDGTFNEAERTTNVQVALVYVDIPAREPVSLILDSLEKAPEQNLTEFTADKEITFYELLKRMVYQFNLEAKAGIKLINEYCRLKPYLMSRLDLVDITVGNIPDIKRKYNKCVAVKRIQLKEGVIKDISGFEDAKAEKGVKLVHQWMYVGDRVRTTTRDVGGAVLGIANTPQEALDIVENAVNKIKFTIE